MLLELLKNLVFFALHIESGAVFPKPLSRKEEQECFRLMSEGDKEAKNRLIEHNLRLVAHIVKKYTTSAADQDEMISIGTIGLIKAVSTFDYTKGARFATYASRCISKATLSLRLSQLHRKQNESLFLMYGKFIGKSAKTSIFSIVSRKAEYCTLPCISAHSDF